jgi:hypothetical protein
MRLMDLFKPYSARLRVAEANAIVVPEISGIKYEVGTSKWTKHTLTLTPGRVLDTRNRPKEWDELLPPRKTSAELAALERDPGVGSDRLPDLAGLEHDSRAPVAARISAKEEDEARIRELTQQEPEGPAGEGQEEDPLPPPRRNG